MSGPECGDAGAEALRLRAERVAAVKEGRHRPDRIAALQAGAVALRDVVCPIQASFIFPVDANRFSMLGSLRWPGVLRVRLAWGPVIAQSLPGLLDELDQAATDAARSAYDPMDTAFWMQTTTRRAALRRAADLLLDCERLPGADVCVYLDGRPVQARAVWHLPGVVRLSTHGTHELVAKSKPGLPFDLDEGQP